MFCGEWRFVEHFRTVALVSLRPCICVLKESWVPSSLPSIRTCRKLRQERIVMSQTRMHCMLIVLEQTELRPLQTSQYHYVFETYAQPSILAGSATKGLLTHPHSAFPMVHTMCFTTHTSPRRRWAQFSGHCPYVHKFGKRREVCVTSSPRQDVCLLLAESP